MKFTKTMTIEIDIEAERERINTPKLYNKKERAYLNKLVDLFEVGDFEGIRVLMKTVPDDYWEYHGIEIDNVIHDVIMWGTKYDIEDLPKFPCLNCGCEEFYSCASDNVIRCVNCDSIYIKKD